MARTNLGVNPSFATSFVGQQADCLTSVGLTLLTSEMGIWYRWYLVHRTVVESSGVGCIVTWQNACSDIAAHLALALVPGVQQNSLGQTLWCCGVSCCLECPHPISADLTHIQRMAQVLAILGTTWILSGLWLWPGPRPGCCGHLIINL